MAEYSKDKWEHANTIHLAYWRHEALILAAVTKSACVMLSHPGYRNVIVLDHNEPNCSYFSALTWLSSTFKHLAPSGPGPQQAEYFSNMMIRYSE